MIMKGESGSEIIYGREQLKKLLYSAWEKGMTAEEFLQMIERNAEQWYTGLTAELLFDYLKEKENEYGKK